MTEPLTEQTGHQHGYPDVHPPCRDVGPDVCLQPLTFRGQPVGYIIGHVREGHDVRCEGVLHTLPTEGEPALWSQEGSLEDGTITLTPSIVCSLDGFHGWVRNGAWVPV